VRTKAAFCGFTYIRNGFNTTRCLAVDSKLPGLQTQRQLRLANTKWFNIIKYNNFRLYFTRKEDIPAITERLSKYSWPIKLFFLKSKFNDLLDVIDYLPKLTNLIKLKSDSVMLV
jgi:hypothetical protein